MSVGAQILKMQSKNKTKNDVERAKSGRGNFSKKELLELREKTISIYGKEDKLVLSLDEIEKLASKTKKSKTDLDEMFEEAETEIIEADGDEDIIAGELKKLKKKIEKELDEPEEKAKRDPDEFIEAVFGRSASEIRSSIADWAANFIEELIGKDEWEKEVEEFLKKINVSKKEEEKIRDSLTYMKDILDSFVETKEFPAGDQMAHLWKTTLFIGKLSNEALRKTLKTETPLKEDKEDTEKTTTGSGAKKNQNRK